MNNLAEHYKAVRARLGMAPKPVFVTIPTPAPKTPRQEIPPEFELPEIEEEGFLADKKDLEAILHIRAIRHPTPPLSMKACFLATGQHFGVTLAELLGHSRRRRIAVPRLISFYLARELTKNSLPQIGSYARRDHTTIMHAHQKVTSLLLAGTPHVCIAVSAIKERLIGDF